MMGSTFTISKKIGDHVPTIVNQQHKTKFADSTWLNGLAIVDANHISGDRCSVLMGTTGIDHLSKQFCLHCSSC